MILTEWNTLDLQHDIDPKYRCGTAKYPWRHLAIGDSFIIEEELSFEAIQVTACRAGKRLGKKFSVSRDERGIVIRRVK